jgi:hypothetical protein
MPARVEPDADDALLGAVSVGADGADPWPGDDAKCLCRVLVLHGASPERPGYTAPGNMVLAPGLPGVVGPGLAELLLSSSPGSPSPSIN